MTATRNQTFPGDQLPAFFAQMPDKGADAIVELTLFERPVYIEIVADSIHLYGIDDKPLLMSRGQFANRLQQQLADGNIGSKLQNR